MSVWSEDDQIEVVEVKVDEIKADTTTLKADTTTLKLETEILDNHVHSRERWFGRANFPHGSIHAGDRITVTNNPVRATSGNNDWSAWICLLGSQDTPQIPGMLSFDAHKFSVVTSDATGTFFVQAVAGPDPAASYVAGLYTEFVLTISSNLLDKVSVDVRTRRVPSGVPIWARVKCPGQNAKYVDFYFGIHEYEVA